MSRQADIAETFSLLRQLCDPRGHDLLASLEQLCMVESAALETVLGVSMDHQAFAAEERSNVVSMIGRYSTKAPCA